MSNALRIPSYRRHKPTGKAVVTIGGRDIYLGRYNSAESRQEYNRLIAEWTASNGTLPKPSSDLKAVREKMIGLGWSRQYINRSVHRLKHVFKWAVTNELVPHSTVDGVLLVDALRAGRSEAREAEPVKPVPEAFIDAVLPYVSPTVAAMIELDRITGKGVRRQAPGTQDSAIVRQSTWQQSQGKAKTHGRSEVRRHQLLPSHQPRHRGCKQGQAARGRRARHRPQASSFDSTLGHPHQLRHNAATNLRREHGIEVARIILGHQSVKMAEQYAEVDRQVAIDVMARIG